MEQKWIASLIVKAEFKLKTFHEAEALAEFLSALCPNHKLVKMGLFELFTNAIEHGNLGITSEEKTQLQKEDRWLEEIEHRLKLPENKDKYADVLVTRQEQIGHPELKIQITDQGPGFDWKKYESENEQQKNLNLEEHGRGIVMAKGLAFKEVIYSEQGNVVTAVIKLNISA